ncbi:hypothetical protein ACFQ0B_56900 [Nonomuraea thailandensis]
MTARSLWWLLKPFFAAGATVRDVLHAVDVRLDDSRWTYTWSSTAEIRHVPSGHGAAASARGARCGIGPPAAAGAGLPVISPFSRHAAPLRRRGIWAGPSRCTRRRRPRSRRGRERAVARLVAGLRRRRRHRPRAPQPRRGRQHGARHRLLREIIHPP